MLLIDPLGGEGGDLLARTAPVVGRSISSLERLGRAVTWKLGGGLNLKEPLGMYGHATICLWMVKSL